MCFLTYWCVRLLTRRASVLRVLKVWRNNGNSTVQARTHPYPWIIGLAVTEAKRYSYFYGIAPTITHFFLLGGSGIAKTSNYPEKGLMGTCSGHTEIPRSIHVFLYEWRRLNQNSLSDCVNITFYLNCWRIKGNQMLNESISPTATI